MSTKDQPVIKRPLTDDALSPFFRALDAHHYEEAIKIARTLITKLGDHPALYAYLLIPLSRLRLEKEVSDTVAIVRTFPLDTPQIHRILKFSFKRRLDSHLLAEFLELGVKTSPKQVDLKKMLAVDYFRLFNLPRAQQIASSLFTQTKTHSYLFWSCLCTLMLKPGYGNDPLLKLGQALLDRVFPLTTTDAIPAKFFKIILQIHLRQGLTVDVITKCLHALTTQAGSEFRRIDARGSVQLHLQFLIYLGRFEDAMAVCADALQREPDAWVYLSTYIYLCILNTAGTVPHQVGANPHAIPSLEGTQSLHQSLLGFRAANDVMPQSNNTSQADGSSIKHSLLPLFLHANTSTPSDTNGTTKPVRTGRTPARSGGGKVADTPVDKPSHKSYVTRGPVLAFLEMNRVLYDYHKAIHDGDNHAQDVLVQYLVHTIVDTMTYFHLYGDRPCFFSDIRTYFDHLVGEYTSLTPAAISQLFGQVKVQLVSTLERISNELTSLSSPDSSLVVSPSAVIPSLLHHADTPAAQYHHISILVSHLSSIRKQAWVMTAFQDAIQLFTSQLKGFEPTGVIHPLYLTIWGANTVMIQHFSTLSPPSSAQSDTDSETTKTSLNSNAIPVNEENTSLRYLYPPSSLSNTLISTYTGLLSLTHALFTTPQLTTNHQLVGFLRLSHAEQLSFASALLTAAIKHNPVDVEDFTRHIQAYRANMNHLELQPPTTPIASDVVTGLIQIVVYIYLDIARNHSIASPIVNQALYRSIVALLYIHSQFPTDAQSSLLLMYLFNQTGFLNHQEIYRAFFTLRVKEIQLESLSHLFRPGYAAHQFHPELATACAYRVVEFHQTSFSTCNDGIEIGLEHDNYAAIPSMLTLSKRLAGSYNYCVSYCTYLFNQLFFHAPVERFATYIVAHADFDEDEYDQQMDKRFKEKQEKQNQLTKKTTGASQAPASSGKPSGRGKGGNAKRGNKGGNQKSTPATNTSTALAVDTQDVPQQEDQPHVFDIDVSPYQHFSFIHGKSHPMSIDTLYDEFNTHIASWTQFLNRALPAHTFSPLTQPLESIEDIQLFMNGNPPCNADPTVYSCPLLESDPLSAALNIPSIDSRIKSCTSPPHLTPRDVVIDHELSTELMNSYIVLPNDYHVDAQRSVAWIALLYRLIELVSSTTSSSSQDDATDQHTNNEDTHTQQQRVVSHVSTFFNTLQLPSEQTDNSFYSAMNQRDISLVTSPVLPSIPVITIHNAADIEHAFWGVFFSLIQLITSIGGLNQPSDISAVRDSIVGLIDGLLTSLDSVSGQDVPCWIGVFSLYIQYICPILPLFQSTKLLNTPHSQDILNTLRKLHSRLCNASSTQIEVFATVASSTVAALATPTDGFTALDPQFTPATDFIQKQQHDATHQLFSTYNTHITRFSTYFPQDSQ